MTARLIPFPTQVEEYNLTHNIPLCPFYLGRGEERELVWLSGELLLESPREMFYEAGIRVGTLFRNIPKSDRRERVQMVINDHPFYTVFQDDRVGPSSVRFHVTEHYCLRGEVLNKEFTIDDITSSGRWKSSQEEYVFREWFNERQST